MIEHSVIETYSWLHWLSLWLGAGAGLGLARALRYRSNFGEEWSKALFIRGTRKTHKLK